MKQKTIVVVGQDGAVHGTYTPAAVPTELDFQIQSRLVAGPDQTLHELDLEIPERLTTRKEIDAFHLTVAQALAKRSKGSTK